MVDRDCGSRLRLVEWRFSLATLAIVLLVVAPVPIQGVIGAQIPLPDLVQRATPSVAWVISQADTGRECGSAFAVDPSGLFVTTARVVGHGQSIAVQFPANNPMPADVVAVDPTSDLAILRVSQHVPVALPIASDIRMGQDAILINYPLCTGPHPAVTKGVVSGVHHTASPGGDLIQIDAAVNPGNTGGLVLTTDGAVIGVIDQEQAGANRSVPAHAVNFAVSNDALKLLVSSATDPAKSHPALTLPLQVTVAVPMRYKGSADASQREVKDVACVSSPHGALSISGIHGELNAGGALAVRTVLTLRTNPDEPSAADFGILARSGSHGVRVVDQSLGDLPPRDVCLSYVAQSELHPGFLSVLPIPYTGFLSMIPLSFEVLYKVNYRVWSPEITGEPLPDVAADAGTLGPPPKRAVVTWTTQPSGNQFRVTLKIVVPSTTDSARQAVKVVAIGSDGQNTTIYAGSPAAGETVTVSTSGAAPLILQVYVGGIMVKQIEI